MFSEPVTSETPDPSVGRNARDSCSLPPAPEVARLPVVSGHVADRAPEGDHVAAGFDRSDPGLRDAIRSSLRASWLLSETTNRRPVSGGDRTVPVRGRVATRRRHRGVRSGPSAPPVGLRVERGEPHEAVTPGGSGCHSDSGGGWDGAGVGGISGRHVCRHLYVLSGGVKSPSHCCTASNCVLHRRL